MKFEINSRMQVQTHVQQLARSVLSLAVVVVVSLAMTACSPDRGSAEGDLNNPATGAGAAVLQGGGATFPAPLYSKWLSEYSKANPGTRVDYQPTGSGAGIKGVQEGTIDFGGTDAPMTDEEMSKSPAPILHIPTVLGAVVLTYNLPGTAQPLRFSPDVVADIFLGRIKRWNDARIKADNPEVELPNAEINVVYRSDGSGTTDVFTDYLSKVSPEWKDQVGRGKSVNFPAGQGGKGNDGVTGQIKQTPNTIGYVELIYAKQNNLPVALLKNSAGNFIEPTINSVAAAAAESVATTPEDLRVSITNAAGADVYPLSSYTYILAYQDQKNRAKGQALADFLWWSLHDGARFARDLNYAPLPAEVLTRAEAKINSITSGGKPVRTSQ